MANMKSGAPAQKVTFATAIAALSSVLVSIFGEKIPALELYQTELIATLTFLAGYLIPPSPNDQISAGSEEETP